MKKRTSLKKRNKQRAWKAFSKYIRLLHADRNGYCTCVTCGVKKQWNEGMQAGHFVDSRNNSVLFREDLVFPQCCACNMFKKGNKVSYTLFMLKQGHTAEEITEMVNMKFKTKKMTTEDYQAIEEEYLDKIAGLEHRWRL